MDFLLPLAVASEVFQFLDYQTLVVVTRAMHTVRRTYEPLALELVKHLVRVAAGRAGALRVRLHETSLFHNLWKLWRRSVCLLEQCLLSASMAHGGLYFTLETERHRLWQPRGDYVPPALRAEVLEGSPMVAFMDLLLVWRLDVWATRTVYPVRYGRVQVSVWELTGSVDGWEVFVEVRSPLEAFSLPFQPLKHDSGNNRIFLKNVHDS